MFHSPFITTDADKILVFDEIATILSRTFPISDTDSPRSQFTFIRDRSLFFNGIKLDLASKPLSFKLVTCLMEADGFSLSRDDLLEKVYDLNLKIISPRMLDSKIANLVKLVSRTRSLCKAAFGKEKTWFIYDGKIWKLFA